MHVKKQRLVVLSSEKPIFLPKTHRTLHMIKTEAREVMVNFMAWKNYINSHMCYRL